MWLECWFLETEVDDSTRHHYAVSLGKTLSMWHQFTQLQNHYQVSLSEE